MKKTIINIITLVLLSSTGFAIDLTITDQIAEKSMSKALLSEKQSYPICGTTKLIPKEQAIIDYYREHPEERTARSLAKTAWNFNEGDTYNFYASNRVTNDYDLVASTCKKVGEHCYIFVADSAWQDGWVDQAGVDAIADGFDNTTPNFPTQGIYEVDTATFGDPPNFDGDPKIIILILDIKDGWSGSGGYIAGYFSSANQLSRNDNEFSNEAEMFYMDCYPANLSNAEGRNDVLNTTAHEFQHMIHYRWDSDEITFPNEGLSEIASYVNGYGLRNDSGYRDNTNIPLFNWSDDDALPDYTRAALWTLYLLEQHPNGLLKMLVQEPLNGGDGINQALATYGATRTWQEIFVDWLIANYLQDTSIDPRWGYAYPNSIASTPAAVHNTADVTGNGSLIRNAGEYVSFITSIPDTITWTASANQIQIKAIKIGVSATDTKVEDVPKGIPYIIKPNGETYSDVTFCIINSSDFTQYNYSYESKGTDASILPGDYELFYEDGTPDGILSASNEGDSLAVWFDGVVGGKLDSIKTIFQGTGRIKFDISKVGTDFLRGEQLLAQKNVNVLNPTDNWILTNLTANNIDASDDFVVSFVLGADPENPTIQVSLEPDTGEYHSRTYTANGSPPVTQWWIFYEAGTPTTPDKYFNYMIRAYVSVAGTTVAIDQNGVVTIPDKFSLEKNYPNPFNPSTTFGFSTPEDGLVKFTVHDLLGRVVYSENRNLFAGNYSFTWDGRNNLNQQAVSGVYFLRMETKGFSQTRKMLMMK